MEGDRPPLRETRQHDAFGADAEGAFCFDQRARRLPGGADARLVGFGEVETADVEPGAHGHAAVDGDGARRCMRQDETHPERGGKAERRHRGLEVMAIGAEAVQQDDAGTRGPGWRDDDGGR